MTRFAEQMLEQVLGLQVRLYGCRERLQAATDAEALHDLRVALRRLRSLLRPLRGLPACADLEGHATELARLSGPLRDLEVLLAQLQQLGLPPALRQSRQARLQQGYARLLASRELQALFAALDDWPARWRQAERAGQLQGARKGIARRLRRQRRRLAAALVDPAHDRHRLRLLIKRVRYGAEAYPQLDPLSRRARKRLKQAQAALGDWHDLWQWLAQTEQQADLMPCAAGWRQALQAAEGRADRALQRLQADFCCD